MKRIILCFILVLLCLPYFAALSAEGVSTGAQAAFLMNGDSCEVIYAHNADLRLPMASTTKIMTALILAECDLSRSITVTKEMVTVEGSSMGLLPGDTVSYHDLLYGMLLASGNDAANTTAYALGGSVSGFAEMMNKKAAALGLLNTHFVTPSGLDDEDHYTTARDLSMLAGYAMQNEAFAAAAGAKSAVLCYGNPPYKRTLTNHNRLLRSYDGAVGVKTGFTKRSGRCLVSAARRDGKYVIAVTLNDPDDWRDHTALLDYGLNALHSVEYSPDCVNYIVPIAGGSASGMPVEISPVSINTLSDEGITSVINLPRFIYAPVNSGDIIGSIEYYSQAGVMLDSVPLKAGTSVKAKSSGGLLRQLLSCFECIFAGI